MLPDFGLEFMNEIFFHELIVVRNVQNDYTFGLKRLRVLESKPVQVGLFHQKDDVRPSDMSFSDDNARIRLSACRARLHAGNIAENAFCSETPNSIPTAHEL